VPYVGRPAKTPGDSQSWNNRLPRSGVNERSRARRAESCKNPEEGEEYERRRRRRRRRWAGRRTRRAGTTGGREREREGEAVSGSACKKEQVSIYTASPRIKDPAEYVGKSRRVLVLLFLFATHSFSLFLPFQLSFFSPSVVRISPKIGKWAVGIRRTFPTFHLPAPGLRV